MANSYQCATMTITHLGGSTTALLQPDWFQTRPPEVAGGQASQAEDLVGSASRFLKPRGNQGHTLRIWRARPYSTRGGAEAAMLVEMDALPKTQANVRITSATSVSWRLVDGVVTSWKAGVAAGGSRGWMVLMELVVEGKGLISGAGT
jgi:hypothetical protein